MKVISIRTVILNRSLTGPVRRPAPQRPKPVRRPVVALGDWVQRWAYPIAGQIDRITVRLPLRYHTHLQGCSACSKRRRFLNRLQPDVRDVRAWLTIWPRLIPSWRAVYRPKLVQKVSGQPHFRRPATPRLTPGSPLATPVPSAPQNPSKPA